MRIAILSNSGSGKFTLARWVAETTGASSLDLDTLAWEQHERLDYLLGWVSEYYTRPGDMSLSGHKALIRAYPGPKVQLLRLPRLEPPDSELLVWLN